MSKAVSLSQMSRFEAAEKAAKSGLDVYRKQDDQAGILHALNVMGSVYFRWGRLAEALENYLESLRIHHQLNDSPAPGILSNIGGVYLQLGDTDRALECYTMVKQIVDEMQGPADLKTAALINMGEIYSSMKMFEPALENLLSAMEIAKTNQMKQAMAAIHDNIGSIMIELKRFDEALDHLQDSMEIFISLEDIKGEALVLASIGKCYLAQDSDRALECFTESLTRFRSLNDARGVSEALIGAAEVLIRRGNTEKALKNLSKALELAGGKDLKPQLSSIYKILYRLFEAGGEYEKAIMHIKLHHDIEIQIKSTSIESRLNNINLVHRMEQTRKEVFLRGLSNIKLLEEKIDQKCKHERVLEGERAEPPPSVEQLPFFCEIEGDDEALILPPAGIDLTYRSHDGYSIEKRVLAVEDDPDVAEFLIDALESNGYPVVVSSSLKKALELVNRPEEKIGCVFVDIYLPDGSGIELISTIREHDPVIPILVGSGYPLSAKNKQFLEENRIAFIQKPYRINSLILNLITMLPAEP
jgi:tetratricopeptide (TPR) repeat protein/ActR/RegA family two-component response regulator